MTTLALCGETAEHFTSGFGRRRRPLATLKICGLCFTALKLMLNPSINRTFKELRLLPVGYVQRQLLLEKTCMRVKAFKKRSTRHSVSEESLSRRLVRLDTRIKNQFDLITSRTGWLLTSQAFLFAAFGTILNRLSDGTSAPALELIRAALFISMPVVGIIACILVHASVEAAYAAITELKGHRTTLLEIASAKFGYENTEPSARITKNGDLPPKVFPGIMLVIWSVLLILVIVALAIP